MRRIQRDSTHEELVKLLTTGDQPIFKEIWRLLQFASGVGIASGKRRQLVDSDSGKNIPDTYFSSPGWQGYLHLIAITETGSSEILRNSDRNQDETVSFFEQYANAGLAIIAEKIQTAATPLDALILLALESESNLPAAPTVTDLI